MMRINSGNLDRICEIIGYKDTVNELGEVARDKVIISKMYAEVKGVRGRELYSNESTVNENKRYIKVVTRYQKGITSLNQLKYDGEIWDIDSVVELGRHEYLEINCSIEVMV